MRRAADDKAANHAAQKMSRLKNAMITASATA
jgi:hypothetical protein